MNRPRRGIPLCKVDAIIDNMDLSPVEIAQKLKMSPKTTLAIRREVGRDVYRYNRHDGISLCKVEQIVAHPKTPAKTLERQIGVSHHTVHDVREELGIEKPRGKRVNAKRLCLYARGDMGRAMELLERHGLDGDVKMSQVKEWCNV